MFKTKEKAKAPEEEGPSEVQTGSLFRKEFRVVIVGMIKELGRRMDEHSEDFNKKKIHKNEIELKKTITGIKK